MIVRSFLLKEKNQKFKAASAELLRHCVSLCAPQTRLRLRQRRSGRSTSFLRLTLTRTRPIQWTIDNWRLTIFFSPSFIHGTYSATVEAQRAAPQNGVPYNQMTINKIMNGFIVLFVVLSCRAGWRRSTIQWTIENWQWIIIFQPNDNQ